MSSTFHSSLPCLSAARCDDRRAYVGPGKFPRPVFLRCQAPCLKGDIHNRAEVSFGTNVRFALCDTIGEFILAFLASVGGVP
jgi:hypothetical protein